MISVLFYEGSIDIDTVPGALEQLLIAYPSLTHRIVADPKIRWVPDTGTISFEVIRREDDEHFRRLARTEVKRQYEKERLRIIFLVGEGKGEIIFAVDHVLMDAKSLYAVCKYFIEAMHGKKLSYIPRGNAWEERLPKEYRGFRAIKKIYSYIKRTYRSSPEESMIFGKDVTHVNTVSYGFSLDKEFLKNLKAVTDREKTNLNAIFAAAAILTAHEIFAEKKAGTVCLNVPVSVRDHMIPKAEGDEMGMFLGAFLQWHVIDDKTELFDLSRAIFDKIKTGVREGEPILLGKLAGAPKKPSPPRDDKHRKRFSHSITVSNPGRLESFPDLPNAKIVGYRNLGSLWTNESITVVVLGYGDHVFVESEISLERLGHFPEAAKALADGIKERVGRALNQERSTGVGFSWSRNLFSSSVSGS